MTHSHETLELREPQAVRRYVLTGLWLARGTVVTAERATAALRWLLMLANQGHAIPPAGFLVDLGALALGGHEPATSASDLPSLDPGLLRRYEDYVLGKLYADLSFERAADAVLHTVPAERDRALTWLASALMAKSGFVGATINPSAVRVLLQMPVEELMQESWQLLATEGLSHELRQQYEALIEAVKHTGDLIAPEDLFEMERGIALADYGQRLALRQVLRAAATLGEGIAAQRPRSRQRRQAATHLLTEDAYPVGGFSSLSTKGSIESLLHSQLAYIEPDDRPDLFDIKYMRDELLYYARDENQFLRRRTTLLVVLKPDLVAARIKDAGLPYQRIVLTLALITALARKLTLWLSDEALQFHFVLIEQGDTQPLADERSLLELLFGEELEHGLALIESLPLAKLADVMAAHARRSQVRSLIVSLAISQAIQHDIDVAQLEVAGPEPLLWDGGNLQVSEETGIDAWRAALRALLVRTL